MQCFHSLEMENYFFSADSIKRRQNSRSGPITGDTQQIDSLTRIDIVFSLNPSQRECKLIQINQEDIKVDRLFTHIVIDSDAKAMVNGRLFDLTI